jgi:hypothetical protein
MDLSLSSLVILTTSVFLCSIVSGMMGMAGGVLFLGILASFIETTYIVPIYATVMIVSSGARTAIFYRYINWRIVFRYSLGLLPGALLGIFIFQLLPKDIIKLGMGIFIMMMIFLPVSKKESRLDMWIFLPVGFAAGFFGIFFGASGPLTSPFYVRQGIIKGAMIGTKSFCSLLEHTVKIALFGMIGVNVLDYGKLLFYLALGVVPGIYIGKLLLNRISDRSFLIAFKVLLFFLAARIIYQQLAKMISV